MYAATLNAQHLTFEVYGVWRKNMLMQDRETGTLWQHATGQALTGPLHGAQLALLPAWETTWGELQATYPQASFAVEPARYTGLLPKPMLVRMLGITHVASLAGLAPHDKRLAPHTLVIGVVINGVAKAYPLATLRAQGQLQDQVGGQTLHLKYQVAGDQVTIHTATGERLHPERQWWLGWSEFHPRSALYPEK